MKRILATTAIVALTAMPVFAQTDTAPAAPEASTTDVLDLTGPQVSPDALIDRTVYASSADVAPGIVVESIDAPDENWDNVGTVEDLILSPEGEIMSVVLDIGGFFGLGAKLVSIPLADVTLVDEIGSDGAFFVVYNGPSAALEDMPELDRAAVNAQGDSFYTAGNTAVGSDEGLTEDLVTDVPPSPQTDDATASDLTDPADVAADAGQPFLLDEERAALTAADLQGTPVHDMAGEHVGNISDIVLSDDGQVADVIVDVGGFLGIGSKSVAITFADLDLTRDDGAMTSSLRATTMITADQFDTMSAWEG